MITRRTARSGLTDPQRLAFLEDDLDELERAVTDIRKLLVGILLSTSTAAIMLAINVLVSLAGT